MNFEHEMLTSDNEWMNLIFDENVDYCSDEYLFETANLEHLKHYDTDTNTNTNTNNNVYNIDDTISNTSTGAGSNTNTNTVFEQMLIPNIENDLYNESESNSQYIFDDLIDLDTTNTNTTNNYISNTTISTTIATDELISTDAGTSTATSASVPVSQQMTTTNTNSTTTNILNTPEPYVTTNTNININTIDENVESVESFEKLVNVTNVTNTANVTNTSNTSNTATNIANYEDKPLYASKPYKNMTVSQQAKTARKKLHEVTWSVANRIKGKHTNNILKNNYV